jgi:aryl-alcohol dehydrogenase-like predicted oxidoreductase
MGIAADTGLETDAKSELPLVLGGNVFGWTSDRAESFAVLDAFVAAGGRHIDTADVYSAWLPGHSGGESEVIIGEWLASRGRRDDVFIATKVGSLAPPDGPGLNNLAAATIATAVEDSLRRLQTDHIDLYWAHRDDDSTEQTETLSAFDALVRAGKVRHLGASNFSAERLASSLAISQAEGLTPYSALQPLYNLLEHSAFEQGPGRIAAEEGLVTFPYSGLASGFLTGKYRAGVSVDSARARAVAKYDNDRGYAVIAALEAVAAAHDASISATALAWLAQQATVGAPIASARTPEQFVEVVQVKDLTLSSDELSQLRAVAA